MTSRLIALVAVAALAAGGCAPPFIADRHPEPTCCAPDPTPHREYDPVAFVPVEPAPGTPPAREMRPGETLADLAPDADIPAGRAGLPPLRPGTRRFGAVVAGCRNDSARLSITGDALRAWTNRDPTQQVACVRAEHYAAAFDVPADDVTDPVRWVP